MKIVQLIKTLDQMGDWLDWEPETIRVLEIGGQKLDEITLNKVMAIQSALVTQTAEGSLGTMFFFDDWRLFEKTVIALNNIVPNFGEIESASPAEIHKAVSILQKIHPVTFSGDVAKYIAAAYMTANIVYCPFYNVVNNYLKETPIKESVKTIWPERGKMDLEKDGVLEIQLARLMAIELAGKEGEVDG